MRGAPPLLWLWTGLVGDVAVNEMTEERGDQILLDMLKTRSDEVPAYWVEANE